VEREESGAASGGFVSQKTVPSFMIGFIMDIAIFVVALVACGLGGAGLAIWLVLKILRSLGGNSLWIILHHILPNISIPLLMQITSDIGPALVTTSSLSFIGMGAQPPTPEWGSMVSQGRQYLLDYWWISTFPGAGILVTVMAFNSLGEAVRESLQIQP